MYPWTSMIVSSTSTSVYSPALPSVPPGVSGNGRRQRPVGGRARRCAGGLGEAGHDPWRSRACHRWNPHTCGQPGGQLRHLQPGVGALVGKTRRRKLTRTGRYGKVGYEMPLFSVKRCSRPTPSSAKDRHSRFKPPTALRSASVESARHRGNLTGWTARVIRPGAASSTCWPWR